MAKGHIVEDIKNRSIHIIRATDAQLFRFTGDGTRDKLMRDQDIPLGWIYGHMRDRCAAGIRIAFNGFIREEAPHMGGTDKWQQPKVDGSIGIRECDWLNVAVVDRGDIDPTCIQKTTTKGKTLGTVVVAADHQHR